MSNDNPSFNQKKINLPSVRFYFTSRYYNMRIRTIRRNENFGLGVVRKLYVESQHRLEADVRVLWALSKRIKRRQDDLLLNSGNQIQVCYTLHGYWVDLKQNVHLSYT